MTQSKSLSTRPVNSDDFTLYSNEKLCEIVVSGRYLGIMQDQMLFAMKELARRRENGDQFPYEDHIESVLKTLPKIDLDLTNILRDLTKFKV